MENVVSKRLHEATRVEFKRGYFEAIGRQHDWYGVSLRRQVGGCQEDGLKWCQVRDPTILREVCC